MASKRKAISVDEKVCAEKKTAATIQHSFRHAGLCSSQETNQFDSEDNLPLSEWISQFNIPNNFNEDLQSYENIDEDVAVTGTLTDEQIVDLVSKSQETPDNQDEEDDQVDKAESPPTIQQALDAANVVVSMQHSTAVTRQFPKEFIFGASTASYQIEGGWNEDDKGESIWDHLTHTIPDFVKDHSNGDIATDTYHNYKRDVEMMRELGLDAYRFSISWPRILPNGLSNYISDAGIAFYDNYINEMLKYNIQPMITLYHWDLPQKLQDLGGFQNPLIADWFEDYARVAFTHFGDRVKLWITFNEPRELCEGYGSAIRAPRVNASGIGEYICAKNLLIAHAKAYHAYNKDFKNKQGGQCGITIHVGSADPLSDTDEDRFAVELHRQGQWGLYAEPIFSEQGGFPKELAEKVAMKSAEQRYPRSRLPEFSEKERAFVRGTSDFFGVNHYYGNYVSATKYIKEYPVPSLDDDTGVGYYMPDDWPQSASFWLKLTPNSIFKALSHLNEKYGNTTFYITENGWSSLRGLMDDGRVDYYRATLESLLDALDAGINVKGYMAWSLMDNFEWGNGYTVRFGLYEVDFEDPTRIRTARKSAFIYKDIVKMRTINHDYEPNITAITIDPGH